MTAPSNGIKGTLGIADLKNGYDAAEEAFGWKDCRKLRQADVLLAQGQTGADVARVLGVTETTLSMAVWVGGLRGDGLKRQKELEHLLLDEMISTGDEGFASKAKARMEEIVANLKILVLATHDLTVAKGSL